MPSPAARTGHVPPGPRDMLSLGFAEWTACHHVHRRAPRLGMSRGAAESAARAAPQDRACPAVLRRRAGAHGDVFGRLAGPVLAGVGSVADRGRELPAVLAVAPQPDTDHNGGEGQGEQQ